MTNILSGITAGQLRRAITIKERIEELELELTDIAGSGDNRGFAAIPKRRRRGMSAAGKARIIAAQKARWANYRNSTPKADSAPKLKRKVPPAQRAKLAAAARARWKKAKA